VDMARRTETMEDIVSEMARLQGSLPARPGPEEVQIAQQTLSRVDAALATRLEELFSQPRPAAVPNPVFRAFQEMREDVLRSQVGKNSFQLPRLSLHCKRESHSLSSI